MAAPSERLPNSTITMPKRSYSKNDVVRGPAVGDLDVSGSCYVSQLVLALTTRIITDAQPIGPLCSFKYYPANPRLPEGGL